MANGVIVSSTDKVFPDGRISVFLVDAPFVSENRTRGIVIRNCKNQENPRRCVLVAMKRRDETEVRNAILSS